MSYGSTPGESNPDPAEQQQGFGQLPGYPGQAWPSSQDPGAPGQAPPSYGQPGYGQAGYFPGYGAGPYGTPPPTYLGWAWTAVAAGVLFSLILGFPTGLVALQNARKVRRNWESGDQQAAIRASRKARTWAIASTVLDVLGLILFLTIATHGAASGQG